MLYKIKCLNFIAGDITDLSAWLAVHDTITIVHAEFQAPFVYVIYSE